MQETWVQCVGWEDPLEEIVATHSCILAWKIPWTEEPGRLWSMGSEKGRSNLVNKQHQLYSACVHAKLLQSCQLFVTLWAVAHQAPLSMGFSRQEYRSRLPCLLQGIFPAQVSNLHLLCLLQLPGGFFTTNATWEAHICSSPHHIDGKTEARL